MANIQFPYRAAYTAVKRALNSDRSKSWSIAELHGVINDGVFTLKSAYGSNLATALIVTMLLSGQIDGDASFREFHWKNITGKAVNVRLRISTDTEGEITVTKEQKRLK